MGWPLSTYTNTFAVRWLSNLIFIIQGRSNLYPLEPGRLNSTQSQWKGFAVFL
jgi:hypothetical protein